MRINEKKTLPYFPDGFTLHLIAFMAFENVEYAIEKHTGKVPEIEDVQYGL